MFVAIQAERAGAVAVGIREQASKAFARAMMQGKMFNLPSDSQGPAHPRGEGSVLVQQLRHQATVDLAGYINSGISLPNGSASGNDLSLISSLRIFIPSIRIRLGLFSKRRAKSMSLSLL